MYRAPSPYQVVDNSQSYSSQPQPYPAVAAAPTSSSISPGAITYTTSTGPDGRIVYHTFKAVAASYQTANGIVSGIQWVPNEATQILPAGAQPASQEFASSWNRNYLNNQDQKALKDWQRDEEKRRKKEEKDSRRLREQEDDDLRRARERDAQSNLGRERRKSFNAGVLPQGGVAFPTTGTTGYSTAGSTGYPSPYTPFVEPSNSSAYSATPYGNSPYVAPPGGSTYGVPPGTSPYTRDRKVSASASHGDLNRQFGDMGIRDGGYSAERERKLSRPRKYSVNYGTSDAAGERPRAVSGNYGERPVGYAASAGAYTPASVGQSISRPSSTHPPYRGAGTAYSNPSPNMRPAEISYNANTGYPGSSFSSSPAPGAVDPIARSMTPFGASAGAPQVYPPGHILEGRPIPQTNVNFPPKSRSTTPIHGMGPQVSGYPQGPMSFPRPEASPRIGGATPLLGGHSPMPGEQQLAAPEGFNRIINTSAPFTPFETMKIQNMNSCLEYQPRMPIALLPHDVNDGDWKRFIEDLSLAWAGRLPVPPNSPPRKRSELASELVDLWNDNFFKARGVEFVLFKGKERRSGPRAGMIEDYLPHYNDSSASSSSESSEESDGSDYIPTSGVYGRPNASELADIARRRREAKLDKRRRQKEKKQRKRDKAKAKNYSLYMTCVPRPSTQMMGGGYGGYAMPGGYGRGGGY
ncbi:hypothetical protein BDQ17DRAFT_1348900 [Cyathus striatus]|nr:hypothetical protein BDQ17DRAFT_1348900 [Cyathus striatus]